jgi:hypothetical protein
MSQPYPIGKYKGKLVIYQQVGNEFFIRFPPSNHYYWVDALEQCEEKKGPDYEFELEDVPGFIIKPNELKDIFQKIQLLRNHMKCKMEQ